MSNSRQSTAHSSQSRPEYRGRTRLGVNCGLSTVNRGVGGWHADGGTRHARRIALVAALACMLGAGGVVEAQYLAVFVDGRILPMTGARPVEDSRFHLDLPGGGYLEVPLSRIDRVIADEVEEKPRPIPPASCTTGFAAQPVDPRVPFAGEIVAAARAAGVHPLLVVAVVRAESDFRPWAVSRVGACGLMQLMPAVWLEQGVRDPYDPGANLRAGCRHLRALLDRFDDLPKALAAYNAGVATVERSGGIPPYRETREFVRQVLAEFCPSRAPAGGAH